MRKRSKYSCPSQVPSQREMGLHNFSITVRWDLIIHIFYLYTDLYAEAARHFSISSFMADGIVVPAARCTTSPLRSTRNSVTHLDLCFRIKSNKKSTGKVPFHAGGAQPASFLFLQVIKDGIGVLAIHLDLGISDERLDLDT